LNKNEVPKTKIRKYSHANLWLFFNKNKAKLLVLLKKYTMSLAPTAIVAWQRRGSRRRRPGTAEASIPRRQDLAASEEEKIHTECTIFLWELWKRKIYASFHQPTMS
jgi:hypothetical protein